MKKIKNFILKYKYKIKKILLLIGVILSFILYSSAIFGCGYSYAQLNEDNSKVQRRLSVYSTNDSDVLLDFAKEDSSVIYSFIDLNSYSDNTNSFNYIYEYSFIMPSLTITYISDDNAYSMHTIFDSNLYITQMRVDNRQARYSTINQTYNNYGDDLDLYFPLGQETYEPVVGLEFNILSSNKPTFRINNNKYYSTISFNIDVSVRCLTYKLSDNVTLTFDYTIESSYLNSLNGFVYDSFDNYIDYQNTNMGAYYFFSNPYDVYMHCDVANTSYDVGYQEGYQEGYDDGRIESEDYYDELIIPSIQDEYYDLGVTETEGYYENYLLPLVRDDYYDIGYDEGYRLGRESALSEGSVLFNAFDLIGSGFNSLNTLLEVNVFPGITIGTLVVIPLVIGVLFVLIKLLQR